jgi:hypothetical protein
LTHTSAKRICKRPICMPSNIASSTPTPPP